MVSKRLLHICASASIAIAITSVVVAVDLQRGNVLQTQAGLTWARQVASQAEGLALRARSRGERDPWGWAIGHLAQGEDSRLVRVSSYRSQEGLAESYHLERSTGQFELTRILVPEEGMGIRVQISLGYQGAFGTHSVLLEDLVVLALLGMLFAIAFLRTGRYFGFDDTRAIRVLITRWVAGARDQLTRHGSHIRDLVRQAQRLAVTAGQSRDHVEGLRGSLREGIEELQGSRDFYREGDLLASRAETLALNMAIEANRLGGDARRIADMATELHRRIQALHAINSRGQALVQKIEHRIEPWVEQADEAYRSFEDVRDVTLLLGQHIKGTTESLKSQARLIKGLHDELGEDGELPEAEAPQATELPPAEESKTPLALGRTLPAPLPPIEDGTQERKSLAKSLRQSITRKRAG